MLYPSILTDSLELAQQQLRLLSQVPGVDVFQFDIIDGQFVDNLTLTPADIVDIDLGQAQIDLHLMVEEPMDFLYETIGLEEKLPVRAVIAQVERMSHQLPLLEETKKHAWAAGLSLDLFTPLDAIEKASWRQLEVIQLMGIEAGFQGRELQPRVLEKIRQVVALRDSFMLEDLEIMVDGGVELDNLEQIVAAGADSVSVGSAIWQADDPAAAAAAFVSRLESV